MKHGINSSRQAIAACLAKKTPSDSAQAAAITCRTTGRYSVGPERHDGD